TTRSILETGDKETIEKIFYEYIHIQIDEDGIRERIFELNTGELKYLSNSTKPDESLYAQQFLKLKESLSKATRKIPFKSSGYNNDKRSIVFDILRRQLIHNQDDNNTFLNAVSVTLRTIVEYIVKLSIVYRVLDMNENSKSEIKELEAMLIANSKEWNRHKDRYINKRFDLHKSKTYFIYNFFNLGKTYGNEEFNILRNALWDLGGKIKFIEPIINYLSVENDSKLYQGICDFIEKEKSAVRVFIHSPYLYYEKYESILKDATKKINNFLDLVNRFNLLLDTIDNKRLEEMTDTIICFANEIINKKA
ncbi:hypothetical protein, partial [Mycoplasmopsis primatum]|uniref:hypothetical protein n=1 Tax=Mycoplasmopsis primatum TaxID=55604 RepID=UPI0005664654